MPPRELPAAYAEFLATKSYDRYKNMAYPRLPTWGERAVPVRFLKKASSALLEENEVDVSACPAAQPLAELDQGSSAFLVLDLGDPQCPVLLWDEGEFTAVEPSLAAFLGKLQPRKKPPRSAPFEKAAEDKRKQEVAADLETYLERGLAHAEQARAQLARFKR